MSNSELTHYGVLGMKWGKRKAARAQRKEEKRRKTQAGREAAAKRVRKSGYGLDFAATYHRSGQKHANRILDNMAKNPNRDYATAKQIEGGKRIATAAMVVIGAQIVGKTLADLNR